ncbi:MAG: single-stranded DNA-binding protein [Williamsia sp.]|nr:single-stranded DNA-binding protein [Williamsia sp.]
MTITGRLTADATVNTTKDERKVVNFSVAINDTYKPKGGERVQVTTYCNCSYWISEKVAQYLKKATLVELTGRIYVTPYVSKSGEPKASLNCHVSAIKFLAWPKEVEVIGKPAEAEETAAANGDDIPF